MTEFQIGILWTSGLLVMVFLGVRVFAAAAIVGLLGTVHIIGWDAGAGIVGTIPRRLSITPSAFYPCLSSLDLSLTTLD